MGSLKTLEDFDVSLTKEELEKTPDKENWTFKVGYHTGLHVSRREAIKWVKNHITKLPTDFNFSVIEYESGLKALQYSIRDRQKLSRGNHEVLGVIHGFVNFFNLTEEDLK